MLLLVLSAKIEPAGAAECPPPISPAAIDELTSELNIRMEGSEQLADPLLELAACHQALGSSDTSRALLEKGLERADRLGHARDRIRLQLNLAELQSRNGQLAFAADLADRAAIGASALDDPRLRYLGTNTRGRMLVRAGKRPEAAEAFAEAELIAIEEGMDAEAADAQINLARVSLTLQNAGDAEQALGRAAQLVAEESLATAERLARLGELLLQLDQARGTSKTLESAAEYLAHSHDLAAKAGHLTTTSRALGTLSEVLAYQGDTSLALRYARAAASDAEQAGAYDLLYRWQWRIARSQRTLGNEEAARSAYLLALDSLEKVRPALSAVNPDLGVEIAPLYRETADLLLQQLDEKGPDDSQRLLAEVRETLERYKVSEILDYFGDECVVGSDEQVSADQLEAGVAVIYPVILEDRLELIVTVDGRIERRTTMIDRRDVIATVRQFRRGLTRRPTRRFSAPGARLYSWLVEPILPELKRAEVETLVFIPDGIMRTVPFAAIGDGEHFLIEEFAVANSLGLSLTSDAGATNRETRVLAGGLTVEVDGFSALPAVDGELAMIGELYGATELRDANFQLAPFRQALSEQSYSIVHIATHGQFKADYRDSFLLTYNGRMTLDSLEQAVSQRRYFNEPVDLLMLSACETAVGDERAALGLAGIALKSGAHSAVATLWSVNDAASAELVSTFYRHLRDPEGTKATALRDAQLALINDEQYWHPFYWAPFLLVGNWL